jgi:hypothetical protein
VFNAPAALMATRALTGEPLRPAAPDPPRRATVTPAKPAPAPQKARRRPGRGRLAWH